MGNALSTVTDKVSHAFGGQAKVGRHTRILPLPGDLPKHSNGRQRVEPPSVNSICPNDFAWPVNDTPPLSFKMPRIIAYVISPLVLNARYRYVAAQLDALSLPHHRVCVDWPAEHARRDLCVRNDGQWAVLVNGSFVLKPHTKAGMPTRMLNLLYNHAHIWDRVAMGKHMALVLEDDVNISLAFPGTLRTALWQLYHQPSWDIVWPGYCCCTPDGASVTSVLAKHSKTGCAQSYLLHPLAAARMLRAMPIQQCTGADHYMNILFAQTPCWKGYAFRQNLIVQDKTTFPKTTHRHETEEVVGW